MSEFEQNQQSRFESMNFWELERDPKYSPTLQEAALEYLKTGDDEVYVEREFDGGLDSRGYVLKEDGSLSFNTIPSQKIGGGKAMERVLEIAKGKLRRSIQTDPETSSG